MSTPQNVRQLDFRVPRRPDVGSTRVLQRWLADAMQLLQERWQSLFSADMRITPEGFESRHERTILETLPGDGAGFAFQLGRERIPTLLVLSGRQLRLLLDQVLGGAPTEWPEPAPLTSAETAVVEILAERCAESLGLGWPGDAALDCRFHELIDKPQRVKLFPSDEPLLVGAARIVGPCGEETLTWLIPREPIEELVEALGHPKPADAAESRARVLSLTQRLPVRMTVEVGRAVLSMAAIADLGEGDVLLLDQSVYRPLVAHVEGRPKYHGHPQTIGSRVGFQITGLIDS